MPSFSLHFKVLGRVQGVFFRKYTEQKANELSLVGWVSNHHDGSVIGVIPGDCVSINQMKEWLRFEGSPMSAIDEAVFSAEESIQHFAYSDFKVRK